MDSKAGRHPEGCRNSQITDQRYENESRGAQARKGVVVLTFLPHMFIHGAWNNASTIDIDGMAVMCGDRFDRCCMMVGW